MVKKKKIVFFTGAGMSRESGLPTDGHRIIAALENDFDVTVITQNGDDYHTRAGSTKVIYLHGEALKNASSANLSLSYPEECYHGYTYIPQGASKGLFSFMEILAKYGLLKNDYIL